MKKKKVSIKKLRLNKSNIAQLEAGSVTGGTIYFSNFCNATDTCPPNTKNCPTIACITLVCVTEYCNFTAICL